jgi:ELWxxDGT repeat protein
MALPQSNRMQFFLGKAILSMALLIFFVANVRAQVLEKVKYLNYFAGKGNEFVEYKGKLYFTVLDSAKSDYWLWVSDGTDTGTHVFYPQNNDYLSAKFLHVFNDKLFFVGWQQGYGFQLWVSDGNADSTKVLYTDSFNEVGSIGFTRYCELNNKLYYTIDGKNIYGTDGSKGGTFLLTKTDNNFAGLVKYKNELYFSNNDSLGNELRKSDGTPLNVSIVKDIDPTNSSYPLICGVVNNRLLFYANDSIHGYELWATNGTDTGTYLIKDCNPKGDIEDRNFYGFHSIVAGNKLFFAVQQRDTILPCCSYISNLNLWATDGTSAGSAPFNSIKLYNGFYYTDKDFIILNNKLFFYEENNISLDSFYYTRTDTIETYNLTANCSNFPAIPTYQNSNYHNFGFYANEIDGKLYYSEYYNHGLAVTDGTCLGTTVYSAKPDYIATK